KRQMIRGHGRLKRREHKNLTAWVDLENRAAAVADIKIFILIKRHARRDPHSLNPLFRTPIGRYAMNGSIISARHKQIPRPIERTPTRIHQRSYKRLYVEIRCHFVERNWNTLAARSAERDVSISFKIDRRIRHRLQIIRYLHGHRNRKWLAAVPAAFNRDKATVRPVGNAHDHAICAHKRKPAFRFAKANHWLRRATGSKPASD